MYVLINHTNILLINEVNILLINEVNILLINEVNILLINEVNILLINRTLDRSLASWVLHRHFRRPHLRRQNWMPPPS